MQLLLDRMNRESQIKYTGSRLYRILILSDKSDLSPPLFRRARVGGRWTRLLRDVSTEEVTDDVKVLVNVMRANGRRRGLAALSISVLDGVVVSFTLRPRYTLGSNPSAVWAPEPVRKFLGWEKVCRHRESKPGSFSP